MRKVAGGILVGLGALNVLYSGTVLGLSLIGYGILTACLGIAMMFLGRRLWRG